ncbi:MAG: TolC family protein [Bacillota bacterium]
MRSTYHDLRALEEQEAALEAAVQTAQDALRVVEAQYKVGLVGRDKVRAAEAALAEAQANLYSLKGQHAALLAAWRYRTGHPVIGLTRS